MKKVDIEKILLIEVLVLIVGLSFTIQMMEGDIVDIRRFIDFPTLLIFLGFSIPALVSTGLWKDFIKAFLVGKKDYMITQLKRCLEAVSMIQKLILISGFFSFFIASIMVLYRLDDLITLGPKMAVICLSGLYTVIFEFLLIPVKSNVQIMIIYEMELDNENENERK